MDDILITKDRGQYRVTGGPILIEETFSTETQAIRYARRQAGDTGTVVMAEDA